MKGLIFVELMNFLDEQLGDAITEKVVEAASLPNDAAFTSVGNYPSHYAADLVTAAARMTGADAALMCEDFGRFIFQRFQTRFPHLLSRYTSARELLEHVQGHIHEEVKVIYPDASPPQVETHSDIEGYTVTYRSGRGFAHIAYGLVAQCISFYSEQSDVTWKPGSTATQACFIIRPRKGIYPL
ncbi:heme NO-binding domain-containing protein [Salinicola avicenniae]|uniref:heme NO-binding domain-containing protein n=1 Tax=Salinicola avicenniae TaxID=2916836 RepID=UPI0020744B1E|nr:MULTISPECIES: heme NO-binding domain-containing protein [unclassified Salinicola]